MVQRNKLLYRLLESLIEEWGQEEVLSALELLTVGQTSERSKLPATGGRRQVVVRVHRKPNAVEQVERLQSEGRRREVLLEIAKYFDLKQFLPSVADVREFLILAGERPSSIKDRTEGFRTLLNMLKNMSFERLQDVSFAAKHAGPSQLGLISDAIAAAGERKQLLRENSMSDAQETGRKSVYQHTLTRRK